MVRTSLRPKPQKPFKPRDTEAMDMISNLLNHPGFRILQEEADRSRELWQENFSSGVLTSSAPADQREIDYRRGYWAGVEFALRDLPRINEIAWKKLVQAEESETA